MLFKTDADRSVAAEKELVVALSLVPLKASDAMRAREIIAGGVDWSAVFAQASQWQVEPVVLGNLRAEFSEALSSEVLRETTERERSAKAHAVLQTMRMVELVKILQSSGIPAIVLKGPAISISAYGDCSRRIFADADLLLLKGDLAAASDVLVKRGYVPDFQPGAFDELVARQHALELSGSRMKVELHWSLMSRFLRFDLRPEELWEKAVDLRCLDFKLQVLAPEHLFLYLCAHGAKHEWMIFRWICDVAQLTRSLSESEAAEVVRLAARTNTRRILALALRLVRETFGEEGSRFSSEAFRSDRQTDILTALVRSRLGLCPPVSPGIVSSQLSRVHPYVGTLMFWLRSRERIADKTAAVAQLVYG